LARKILLADDSVTAQNMGRKILTDAGYDVVTVNNGSAALKRVAELKPDLVVLDVYMPGYSGLEVCARLKDSPDTSRIPILLTVGKLEPFKPEEANRVRADGFIVKPFEASELLSALTRLEDRMVPAQADGSRFSTSVSGIERFNGDPMVKKSAGGDASESGWKNRLRFPSKKKKEEAEPEPEPDFVTPSSFREFRQGAGKAPAGSAPFPLSKTSAAGQEPGLVPDIPRDITPEELDALSDLVAKLDGPPAGAEDVTPISEKIGGVEAPVPEAKNEVVAASAPPEVKKETGNAPAAVDAQLAATPIETSPAPAAIETTPVDAAVPTVMAEEKAVAQESAPADKSDEPTFASDANAAEAPPVGNSEVQAQGTAGSEPSAPVVEAKSETAAQLEESQSEESKTEAAPKPEEIPAPVAASSQERAAAEGSSPSAEELAAALRFLTPSQTPGAQTLAEPGAALADKLSRGSENGNRWVAEAMALSPEEASGSLEAEMFRTFAASAGGQAPSNSAPSATGSGSEPGVAGTEIAAEIQSRGPSFTPAEESLAAAMAASASERAEPEQKDSPAKQAEEAPEEVAAATFADAVRGHEMESVSATAQTVTSVSAETPSHEEDSISENGPGGQEAMGKETKGKGGKSNWHQIRSAAPTAGNDTVKAAKQAVETPKTMAAAASADGADPNSIASIVDSVLADLRPRIVEEIAKKLAKK
jgi:twitching motility two-component system response regulator PilG